MRSSSGPNRCRSSTTSAATRPRAIATQYGVALVISSVKISSMLIAAVSVVPAARPTHSQPRGWSRTSHGTTRKSARVPGTQAVLCSRTICALGGPPPGSSAHTSYP
ncbi:hypothetical protein [Nocardioides endophyticus]|uniref:hypothetical protein n=1 Tax=Nocardioides endophyticus TaxID=1353775 RepID=UPI0031E6F906